MATSFAQQPHQFNNTYGYNFNNHRAHYSQSNFTPPSSITPPSANVSPTNHHLPKQIKPARNCGYIPAALRPTEMPLKAKRPLTPPRSTHSSLDSQASISTSESRSLPVTPVEDCASFIAPLGQVTRIVTDEWNEELGQVTGAPTRGHWKPDSSATCCTSPTCTTIFTFLARRHHCRRCGGIFCTSHSARVVPLDQEARFHPSGVTARACENCWNDYQIWQHDRKSRASSITSGGTATPPTNIVQGDRVLRGADFLGIKSRQHPTNSFAAGNESVRDTDWNWSTF